MIFAELASDPTDMFAFEKFANLGLSASESVAYWYLLTSLFYIGIFIFAFIMAKTGYLKPVHIIYLLMFLVAFGAYRSILILGGAEIEMFPLAIVVLATIVSFGILFGIKRKVEVKS